MYKRIIKHAFDYIASLLAIVVLFPFFLLLSLLIWFESGSPVLFTQIRVGKDGRHFRMYKFRTMFPNSAQKVRSDGTVITEKNDPRVTKIGKKIRFGLDELPQLWNILKGEMSLIGPRPDLPMHFEMYTEQQRKKYSIKPGLTNLPAICGRNTLPLNERIRLDLYYAENVSFLLDTRIVLFTLLMPFGIQTRASKFIKA